MPTTVPPPSPSFASDDVRHRIASRVLSGFDQWWQMPVLLIAAAAVVAHVVVVYRRDAAGLPRRMAALLAALRLVALLALAAALLDVERIAEHEILTPSRVAVLIDTSASMSIADAGPDGGLTRAERTVDLLAAGGLLEALRPRQQVTVWRFDADVEPLVTGSGSGSDGGPDADWRSRLAPRGAETRLGDALALVRDREPVESLAGIVLISDGATNAGKDPVAVAGALAGSDVPIHALGVGSDVLPANVRIADLVVPSRVFPGDRFPVTVFLQAQGLAGQRVNVELNERSETAGESRSLGTVEALLEADGQLVPVRFDAADLETTGRHSLEVRIAAPAEDSTPGDDTQAADVEVVDRVTNTLVMAGGPGREYQFLRNVLQRDDSFAVDVLLATAGAGVSQDARRVLEAFPDTDATLGEYDAVIACDYDWRLLDPAARQRLERWVSRESGGLVLVAGSVCMDGWLADAGMEGIRGLHPVEFGRPGGIAPDDSGRTTEPRHLDFTRDGGEAEFLRLASTRVASDDTWRDFPGVFACRRTTGVKPGATVYARLTAGDVADGDGPVFMAGQFFGSGSVLYVGSGELWRLRSIADGAYERLVTQVVRHVTQGRLLRGGRRGRLLVERDRYPIGATITVRVVAEDEGPTAAVACHAVAPDGSRVSVPLAADAARPGTLEGGFAATQAGSWRIEHEPAAGSSGERLTKLVQVHLPDRELTRPKLDRDLLAHVAGVTGGRCRFVDDEDWTTRDAAALAALLPDRSRREYRAGAPDRDFKHRLNAGVLAVACGCLCAEWIVRRLCTLA